MKCKSCGAEFDGKFCPYCGEKQVEDTANGNEIPVKNIDVQPKSKAKKPIYKKWWFWVIAVLLLFGIIGSFGEDSSDNDASEFNWSNMTLGSMLPTPESTLGKNLINTEDYLSIDILDVSPEEYQEYVNACREKGFTVEVSEYDTYYDAQNADGYKLMLYYFESDEELSIDLNAPNKNDVTTSENSTTELSTKDTESTVANEESVLAEDAVVNRFINEFNSKTKYDMTDISKGNIRTKFFAVANDCYIEMINANDAYADCFSISISGGQEIKDRDKMFDVFSETLKVLDPSITTDKITEIINYLKNEQYMVSDYKVTDTITIETYVPIVELSYGKSDCRIDVISSDYR